ncbi:MAG: hypothetical protein AAF744_13840 [Pseudomonadota bacterium]
MDALTWTFVLGTGLFAGIVTFLLNLTRDLLLCRQERKEKANKEKLVLANRLIDLAIRCRDIIDDKEEAAIILYWSEMPEAASIKTNLMETIQNFDFLDVVVISELILIDLKHIEFRRMHRAGEFERGHLSDNRFDPVSSRLRALEELFSDCLELAIKLQRSSGLDSSATIALRSPYVG